ncbi:MAG: hypothetical protein ACRD0W_23160 [Acidimicrobiales bacterium]
MSHWLTNRGKLLLMQGLWDDAGATAVDIGLLVGASTPAAIDTEAEIQDLNTVAELLALTGVDEPVGGWYTRKDLSRTAAAEDDTNNRVNMDTANVVWTAATAGETIYGAFWYDATTDTNDTTRLFCGLILFTPVPLNGSDFTLTITDLVRAS